MHSLYDDEELNIEMFERPYTCIMDAGYTPITLHKTKQGKFFFYDKDENDLDHFSINHQSSLLKPAVEALATSLTQFKEAGFYHFSYKHPDMNYFSGKRDGGLYFLYYENFAEEKFTTFDREMQLDLEPDLLMDATRVMTETNLPVEKRLLIVFEGTTEAYYIDNPLYVNYYKMIGNIPDFGESIREVIQSNFDELLDDRWQDLIAERGINEYAGIMSLYYLARITQETELNIGLYNHKLLDYTMLGKIQYPNIYTYLIEKGNNLAISYSELFGTETLLSSYAYVFLQVIDELYARVDPKSKRIIMYESTQ